MVEFSNRNDVESWLFGKRRGVAVVLAARAALRLAPLLSARLGPRGISAEIAARDMVLPVLLDMATPWVAAKYPAHGAEVAKRNAARAAYTRVAPSARDRAVGDVYSYAYAASTGAAKAAGAAYSAYIGHADYVASAAAATYAAAYADADSACYAATLADAEAIENGQSSVALADLPLWPHGEPDWSREQWTLLKRALLSLNQNWEVWTEWYEARRDGRPANEALEIARVMIAAKIWEQGPEAVNAEIKRLIKEHDRQEREIFDSAWKDEPKQVGKTPEVPAPLPAAVKPIWARGRLTIPRRPTETDLSGKKFAAALLSLRSELRDFAGGISGEANIDKRFVQFVQRLTERIPDSAPSQNELFSLGHVEQVFAGYATTVDQEWPDFLRARFHALVLQFDRTLRQSRLWREFKRNAAKEAFTAEQVASAIPLAQEAANALRSDEAPEFVDHALPEAVEQLSRTMSVVAYQYPGEAITEGNQLLAVDLIESINNILKPIADAAISAAVAYAKGFGKGFKKAASKQGPKDGEKAFKWLRRIVIRVSVGGGAAAGTFVAFSQLISKYPQAFDWLSHVLHHLSIL